MGVQDAGFTLRKGLCVYLKRQPTEFKYKLRADPKMGFVLLPVTSFFFDPRVWLRGGNGFGRGTFVT